MLGNEQVLALLDQDDGALALAERYANDFAEVDELTRNFRMLASGAALEEQCRVLTAYYMNFTWIAEVLSEETAVREAISFNRQRSRAESMGDDSFKSTNASRQAVEDARHVARVRAVFKGYAESCKHATMVCQSLMARQREEMRLAR